MEQCTHLRVRWISTDMGVISQPREPQTKSFCIFMDPGWAMGASGGKSRVQRGGREGGIRSGKVLFTESKWKKSILLSPPFKEISWWRSSRWRDPWIASNTDVPKSLASQVGWVLDYNSLQRLQCNGCAISGVGKATSSCEACQMKAL